MEKHVYIKGDVDRTLGTLIAVVVIKDRPVGIVQVGSELKEADIKDLTVVEKV